ncbi:MAG: DUF2321 domain-containing protein [Helicobacteraceae bacterium]|jgi:hypothetical protein|nr:DUF2321 domain-containing protein [Helicobacteraceae bacterium]
MGSHDIAQVCLNGHVINSSAQSSPEFNQNFCDQCGAETITSCQKCNTPIRGKYHASGMIIVGFQYIPPSYCHNCGSAFPWLQTALDSATELLDFDEQINAEDKELLINSMKEISKDSPRTELNALKIKKLAKKLGADTYDAFIKIAVDVGTEIAKKALMGA